jgi:hypothetical protein
MKYIIGLLFLTGCAPAIRFPDWDASDASGDRAEVIAVDVPRADVVVIDGAVWITDRPDAPAVDAVTADAGTVADDGLVAADAGAHAVDASVVVAVDAPSPCGALEARCGGVCVPLLTTAEHCGACGRACPGGDNARGVCNGGRCELACDEGTANCGRGCRSTAEDRENCGGCGFVCGTREVCRVGNCSPCAAGESVCEGRCVRLDTVLHCGRCGYPCGPNSVCIGFEQCVVNL